MQKSVPFITSVAFIMETKKSYRLSVYLLKKDVKNFSDALRNPLGVEEYPIKKGLGANGVIFIGRPKGNLANWVNLLQQGTTRRIGELISRSNRALLLMKLEKRIYAVTFGFGKYLLRDGAIDRAFGLITAINMIDADKLRSLNKANVDDFTLLTTTQSSKRAKAQEFNVDPIRDLLRGVTGEPYADYNNVGPFVTGNEGVTIVPSITFDDIPDLLKAISKASRSRRYKARFDWVDNVRHERDPIVLEKLNEKLTSHLRRRKTDAIHLTSPVMIDWENFEGYSFTPKGDLYVDFDIEKFYVEKASSLSSLTWEKVESRSIYLKYSEKAEPNRFRLVDFLNFQTTLDGKFYVFSFNEWFRVNQEFSQETEAYVKTVKESGLDFIDCERSWNEETYNRELANSNEDYYLLDQKLIYSHIYKSRVEVCDVFSRKNKEFVHVKIGSRSSSLSHLFAQGRISCNLMASDDAFRKNLRRKLKEQGLPMNIVPERQESLNTRDFTVTFAIIADGEGDLTESLPFFSLLNLRLTISELHRLNFKVRIKKVPYAD